MGHPCTLQVFSGLLYKTEPIAVKVLQHANWQAESATIFDEIDVMRKIRSAYLVQYLGACIKVSRRIQHAYHSAAAHMA